MKTIFAFGVVVSITLPGFKACDQSREKATTISSNVAFELQNYPIQPLFKVGSASDNAVLTLGDPGTEENLYGFEGGKVAKSSLLTGPWKRITEVNPVRHSIENPLVTRLADGRYVALFDGCGDNRKIGYMVSSDGINWSKEIFFELDREITKWWGLTRTPLGLVQESEDLFTIFFTAYNKDFYEIPDVWKTNDDGIYDGYFASIGWFQVQLIR